MTAQIQHAFPEQHSTPGCFFRYLEVLTHLFLLAPLADFVFPPLSVTIVQAYFTSFLDLVLNPLLYLASLILFHLPFPESLTLRCCYAYLSMSWNCKLGWRPPILAGIFVVAKTNKVSTSSHESRVCKTHVLLFACPSSNTVLVAKVTQLKTLSFH